jgi:hypothetical protein
LLLVFATIDCVVAPVDQRYDAPLDAVKVTLPPAQNVVGPEAVMLATAGGLTVTPVVAEVALHPFALVVTV